jgi:hypothetical protein
VNWRTPNNGGLGTLEWKFTLFGGYSLWAPKMPNQLCESEHLFCDCAYAYFGMTNVSFARLAFR